VESKKIAVEPATRTVIRFQDCDPFGHLNNARYLDYFINAREEHLVENYDLDIYKRQKRLNENWVIAQHQIAYIAPVVFREEVTIVTCVIQFTENSILMEGRMLDPNQEALKAILWTRFTYISFAEKRVVSHPDNIMRLFQSIIVPGQNLERKDFDARVRQLRNSYTKPVHARDL
jgi:thioesterase III